jgi:hypothetical protein
MVLSYHNYLHKTHKNLRTQWKLKETFKKINLSSKVVNLNLLTNIVFDSILIKKHQYRLIYFISVNDCVSTDCFIYVEMKIKMNGDYKIISIRVVVYLEMPWYLAGWSEEVERKPQDYWSLPLGYSKSSLLQNVSEIHWCRIQYKNSTSGQRH